MILLRTYRFFVSLTVLLCGIYALPLSGQVNSLSPKVVSSGGNYSTAAFGSITSTIGEPAVQTFTATGTPQVKFITQGFEQPQATSSVTISSITATPSTTVCNGYSATLVSTVSGTSPFTYSWAPAAGLNCTTCSSPVATPTITTTYTLTVTDAVPTVDTETITITVYTPSVSVSISPNDSICPGNSVTVTGNATGGIGAFTYTWLPGGFVGNPFVTTPATTTAYQVYASDANSCSSVSNYTVTVVPNPTVSISGNTTLCSGNSTTLTATGASGYAWSPGGQTTSSIVVSPTVNTTYVVNGTQYGCSSNSSITVTVTTTPAINTIGSNSPICAGQSLSLNSGSSGATSYSWNGPNGFTSTAQNPIIGAASTNATGTYSLTVSANGCTSPPSTHSVTVNPIANTPLTSPNVTLCTGQNLSLTASSNGSSYSWSGPAGFTSTLQNPVLTNITTSMAGTYSVTASFGGLCPSAPGITVATISQSPSAPSANSSPSQVCVGSSFTLTASSVSGATGYSWTGPNGFTSTLQNPSIASTGTQHAGTYTVTASSLGGCVSPASTTTVGVDAQPIPVNAGLDQTICGLQGSLNAATPTIGTGVWTLVGGPGGVNFGNAASPVSTVSVSLSGSYQFRWTLSNGACSGFLDDVIVLFHPSVMAASTATAVTCNGSCNGSALATPTGGTAPFTYLWNDPSSQTAATAVNLCAGNYSCLVTDTKGCTASTTITVTQPNALAATVNSTSITCNGGNNGAATVLPTGGVAPYTYSWSTGATTSSITGLSAGGYTVTVTDSKGCTLVRTGSLGQPPAFVNTPVVNGTSCASSCDGTANPGVSGGTPPYTYAWGDPSSQTTATATGLCPGSYSVLVTDANGCTITYFYPIGPGPTLNLSASATSTLVCSGDPVTLSASGGTTYQWNPGGQTTSSITVNPTVNSNYSVTVSIGACSKDTVLSVSVNPTPSVSISGSSAVCQGDTITLTANASGVSYSWSTGATTSVIQAVPTSATAYSVTVTNAQSCSASAGINITVNASPNVQINGPTTVCSGNTVSLTASGASSYVWSNASTQNPLVITPTSSVSYTVTGTNVNGCSDTATIQVNTTTPPIATISVTPSASICAGTTITLTGSGGTSYFWINNSQSTIAISATPTATNTYTLVAYNGSCTDTTTQTITVSSISASIAGNNTLCTGGSTTLSVTPTGGTSPYTYSWSTNPPQTTPSVVLSYTASGVYTYTVNVIDATGCSSSATYTVNVNAMPAPTITAPSTLCQLASGTLSATGGTSYSWSTGATTSSISVTPILPGNQTYTVTVSNGSCSADTFATINVLPLPSITGTASSSVICPGDMITLTGSGGVTYSWINIGLTNPVAVTPSAPTTYTVFGMGINGCFNYDTVSVSISSISVNAGPDITICPGFTAQLLATVSGNTASVNYFWSPGNLLNDSTVMNPSATPDSTVDFAIEVFNNDGCWAKDTVRVVVKVSVACVLHIYNGITPNGDADNNVWWIDGIKSFPDNNVAIFNRWGTRVWSAKGYDNKDIVWSGKDSQGQELPDGTYYYIIEIQSDSGKDTFSGWVEVTR